MPGRKRRLFAIVLTLTSLSVAGVHAATHNVFVGDNFFSPAELSIEIGDTVRWSNSAGFHNVYSCTSTQIGCDGAVAAETFSNGEPRNGPWFYAYTFTEAGINPYVCQSHASFMQGTITVAAPTATPEVPDGRLGHPVTVDRASSPGGNLVVAWDGATCPAQQFNVIYGTAADLPTTLSETYGVDGAECDVSSPWTWEDSPTLQVSGGLLWWLVVASDGDGTEGRWGANTVAERWGPLVDGASGVCGTSAKSEDETCTP